MVGVWKSGVCSPSNGAQHSACIQRRWREKNWQILFGRIHWMGVEWWACHDRVRIFRLPIPLMPFQLRDRLRSNQGAACQRNCQNRISRPRVNATESDIWVPVEKNQRITSQKEWKNRVESLLVSYQTVGIGVRNSGGRQKRIVLWATSRRHFHAIWNHSKISKNEFSSDFQPSGYNRGFAFTWDVEAGSGSKLWFSKIREDFNMER